MFNSIQTWFEWYFGSSTPFYLTSENGEKCRAKNILRGFRVISSLRNLFKLLQNQIHLCSTANNLQFWNARRNTTSTVSAQNNYYDLFKSFAQSDSFADPALGSILRGGVWFSPMGMSLWTSGHKHLHAQSCNGHSGAQRWSLVRGDGRGNLCHQAACKVLQSKDVAEPQGTQAGCTPDHWQPPEQTGNTVASNTLGSSSETELAVLCRFLYKQRILNSLDNINWFMFNYKLVLKQCYDGDLPHQSMLEGV